MANPLLGSISNERCLTLVGMAGAGKSTLGALLSRRLGWAHLDTDRLIEATCGLGLQELVDREGVPEFLRIEEDVVASVNVRRCVISTGGSVVYGERAVVRLREAGPVVYLRIDLPTFLERVRDAAGRGFARPGGKSMEEVFAERQPLYARAADHVLDACGLCPDACVEWILKKVSL